MRSLQPIRLQICSVLLLVVDFSAQSACAQLRVVSYNTLGNPTTSGDFSNWNVVLQAIGDQSANGIAKRIGIMALQEVDQPTAGQNAKNIASLLNVLYGVSTYQASVAPFGDGFNLQAFVYDTQQVELLNTLAFDIGTRPSWRGRFRPLGYTSSAAEFYVYSSHLKAFDGFQSTRANESALLRSNGNNLGQGAHIIYAGDYNLTGGAGEPAYANMLSAGNGQAIDPQGGDFTDPLKKSYSSSSPGSRIDFQFITNELSDDEGLDLIDGNYRVFGRVQQTPSRIITSPSQLTSASDHLPVVADYQLPAMMHAELATVPMTLLQGANYLLDLSVSNVAPVVAALGTDELDYTLNLVGGFGGLLSAASGTDDALGSANLHQIALDTSTPGVKSGTIQVTSSSAGVANGSLSFNVAFEVLAAALAGDYNNDGTIDAADYSTWRDAFQSEGATLLNDPTPGSVDETDYAYWRDHFGETLSNGGTALNPASVPEPSTLIMFAIVPLCFVLGPRRRGKQVRARYLAVRSSGVASLLLLPLAIAAHAEELRIATYNASLSPDAAEGQECLPARLAKPGDSRAERVAEIIQRIDPDILLINEFNWDEDGAAADDFAQNYLRVGHDAAATGHRSKPVAFPYRFLPSGASSPFNTGVPGGKDLDGNGRTGGAPDAYGFGQFPGQYGMVLFSKFPIKVDEIRTFQQFRWQDMPGNLLPRPFYAPDEVEVLRLSSKSHWDIPIDVHGQTLHVLASHPTPPVFDGPEDRNGRRRLRRNSVFARLRDVELRRLHLRRPGVCGGGRQTTGQSQGRIAAGRVVRRAGRSKRRSGRRQQLSRRDQSAVGEPTDDRLIRPGGPAARGNSQRRPQWGTGGRFRAGHGSIR